MHICRPLLSSTESDTRGEAGGGGGALMLEIREPVLWAPPLSAFSHLTRLCLPKAFRINPRAQPGMQGPLTSPLTARSHSPALPLHTPLPSTCLLWSPPPPGASQHHRTGHLLPHLFPHLPANPGHLSCLAPGSLQTSLIPLYPLSPGSPA